MAAPSANKFGHVSPTTAEHVYKDFENDQVCILDGGQCPFGIESTVIKISKEQDKYELLIIRKGGISSKNLKQIVEEQKIKVEIKELKRDHSKPETENL